MQHTFHCYLLMHDAQHPQFTTLHSLTRILLLYCSAIFWYCRNWGLIFEITFYQPNYLSTILQFNTINCTKSSSTA